ncbi:MAG: glycosyltransferase [Desulfovibrio sp.]|nr:glycosyltransferase [Desulfovibrio sp.]
MTKTDNTVRRPKRVSLADFCGRMFRLPEEAEAWREEGAGASVLLLGLGPGRPWTLPFLAAARDVYWLEAPATLAALAKSSEGDALSQRMADMPAHWQRVTPEEAVRVSAFCRRLFYVPGLRLAPDFWGHLLGRLDAALCGRGTVSHRRAVLLPGSENQLLHQELRIALGQCGFGPVLEQVPSGAFPQQGHAGLQGDSFLQGWRRLLGQGRPDFLLSVNLRGMDPEGRVFYLCREQNIPVALWFVDNPWHVLSRLRFPWWRDTQIFVTDDAFLSSLRREGARHVHHLPLAVAPHMWQTHEAFQNFGDRPLFVGRSAFPDRERFFAAARVPQSLEDEATGVLRASSGPGEAPNFFWWHDRLGGALWPGHDVRRVGLGAERCAQANRVRWLLAAGAGRPEGIRIVGDARWKNLLPDAEVLPQVDYYTTLPQMYAGASAVLNVTSLLMPQSLSQRHFDVWASGGLLLSDATQGLDIFPRDLTEPIILRSPEDFMTRWDQLRSHPEISMDLRRAWQEHLHKYHGYEHRVRRMVEILVNER